MLLVVDPWRSRTGGYNAEPWRRRSLVTDLPSSIKWENRVKVSSILPILFYQPLNVVNQIPSPTLLLAADLDTYLSLSSL